MGIVSCLGNTLDEVAENLREGKSGITYSEELPGCKWVEEAVNQAASRNMMVLLWC